MAEKTIREYIVRQTGELKAGPYENAPTTAIVVEEIQDLVRCRDCKHYQFADNRAFGMPVKMCEWFGFEDVDDDDFCSRAERRTDAHMD